MSAFSTIDCPMMPMGTQKGGASSSTTLQPQLTSSSLCLTPVLGTASDVRGMFAKVMTGLEELQQDMTKKLTEWSFVDVWSDQILKLKELLQLINCNGKLGFIVLYLCRL